MLFVCIIIIVIYFVKIKSIPSQNLDCEGVVLIPFEVVFIIVDGFALNIFFAFIHTLIFFVIDYRK